MRHVILVLSSHSQREQRNSLLSLRRQLRHVIHTLRNSLNYTERTNSLVTVYILSHRAYALWDFCFYPVITLYFVVFCLQIQHVMVQYYTLMVFNGTIGGIRMSGIFDRRAKRFISTEQAERAVPSRTVMASRVARDDVNRSERVQKKRE